MLWKYRDSRTYRTLLGLEPITSWYRGKNSVLKSCHWELSPDPATYWLCKSWRKSFKSLSEAQCHYLRHSEANDLSLPIPVSCCEIHITKWIRMWMYLCKHFMHGNKSDFLITRNRSQLAFLRRVFMQVTHRISQKPGVPNPENRQHKVVAR